MNIRTIVHSFAQRFVDQYRSAPGVTDRDREARPIHLLDDAKGAPAPPVPERHHATSAGDNRGEAEEACRATMGLR